MELNHRRAGLQPAALPSELRPQNGVHAVNRTHFTQRHRLAASPDATRTFYCFSSRLYTIHIYSDVCCMCCPCRVSFRPTVWKNLVYFAHWLFPCDILCRVHHTWIVLHLVFLGTSSTRHSLFLLYDLCDGFPVFLWSHT